MEGEKITFTQRIFYFLIYRIGIPELVVEINTIAH